MAREPSLIFKGREFSAEEVALIGDVVRRFAGLSRQELANTACELLDWRRPNGQLKTWECEDLLDALESAGGLQLPALRVGRPRGSRTSVPHTERGEPQERLHGTLGEVAPVSLRRVDGDADRRLWRELVGRYHYLGHAVPFGAHLRWFIEVARPTPRVVGCVQASSPAWKLAARDRWIGWSDVRRREALQHVVDNSRFLILPWVEVRFLASAVLAMLARELPAQWETAYGVRPLLLESFVDVARFPGTCYRAANWIELGLTQGRGRMDRRKQRQGACPKAVFVYPLVRRARERLRGED
jgi:hypothetical protein